jgi:dTDP-4-dehydrorhamnose reductase
VKLCITGASGKLGTQLRKLFPDSLAPPHGELDITNAEATREYIVNGAFDTVIHCAALTSIRYCEEHREETYNVNVNGTRNLAEALVASSAKDRYFVYLSTACVFPGDSSDKYYSEDDVPYPKNLYSVTKLLGEYIVNSFSKILKVLVIRTNFIERGDWPYPTAFSDRYATYLYSDQLGKAIKELVDKKMTGLVHICGNKRMSMYEFARLTDPKVKPMTLKDYSGPPLTVNMSLTSHRIPPIPFGQPKKERADEK